MTRATPAGKRSTAVRPTNRSAVILSIRGLCLFAEYRYTGSVDRLNAAVATCQQAVDASPGQVYRAEFQLNLGVCLTARFERTGNPADGDAAVKVTGQALLATDPADHTHAHYLATHAAALLLRRVMWVDPGVSA
jgi:hypothetical protein